MKNDRRVGEFFDGCAAEGIMDSFVPEEEPRVARMMARWGVRPGLRIIEPGCGSGRLTERLARAVGRRGMVLAFDLSESMIRKAQRRRLPRRARFLLASAHAIPARTAAFDSAICFHAFPHFEDPPRALAELARTLKRGGSLWIEHLRCRAAVNKIHRGAGPPIRRHLIPPAAAMKKLLRTAGFRLKRLSDSSSGYSVLAVRDLPLRAGERLRGARPRMIK